MIEQQSGRCEGQRRAVAGELCTCGRPAGIVFVTERFGEVGWCGRGDGGAKGRCRFCGDATGHEGERCDLYRSSPTTAISRRSWNAGRDGAQTGGTDLFAVVLAALFGLDGLLWLAGRGRRRVLEGRHLPKGHLLAPLAALAEPARPERAWGGRVAGPVLY